MNDVVLSPASPTFLSGFWQVMGLSVRLLRRENLEARLEIPVLRAISTEILRL